MPAKIVVYSKPDDAQDFERFVSSPNTHADHFTRNVYNSPDCTTIIGVAFYKFTSHTFLKIYVFMEIHLLNFLKILDFLTAMIIF